MAISRRTLKLSHQLKVEIGSEADKVTRSLATAWVTAWDELSTQMQNAVTDILAAATRLGRWLYPWELARVERLGTALTTTERALITLGGHAGITISGAVGPIVAATGSAEPYLIASQLPAAESAAAITRVSSKILPSALDIIVARTQSQIVNQLRPLTAEATDAMRRSLITGIAVGSHPSVAARDMVKRVEGAFNGGLARASTVARTELLDAYRTTSTYAHTANSDILDGWQWLATLDKRTCFPAGTIIRTKRGNVAIEEIRDGDFVLTHSGSWRRAYDPMSRPHVGSMVTIDAGPLSVSATADHPFLIERQGELHWIEARNVRRGDCVLSDVESSPDGSNHALGEAPVVRSGNQAQDGKTTALQEDSLAGVSVADLGVPVGFVNLDGDREFGEEEVDRTGPSGDGRLLDVVDRERVECPADVALRFGLSGESAIAAHRAELGTRPRNDADLLLAGEAHDFNRWPTTDFGAGRDATVRWSEDRSAPLAWSVDRCGSGAVDRAVHVSVGVADRNREFLAAGDTDLVDLTCSGVAVATAVPAWPGSASGEGCAALLADGSDARLSEASTSAMWRGALMGGVAGLLAEESATTADGTRWDLEMGSALLTSPLHRYIVSNVVSQNHALIVYNFEVEGDHSYVADGIAVHNCPACWAKNGDTYPVSAPGPWGHPNCRCARVPVVRAWSALGIDIPEPPSSFPDAQKIFNALPPEDQLAIMGPGRLAALQSGRAQWSDLATRRDSSNWRPSYIATPVRDLNRAA